ncbi:MAG: SEC-C domain-containing protein [Actinobacteria bacterium]|nr:SEC-C domain-containing protein [Actinomycetota bacterium]
MARTAVESAQTESAERCAARNDPCPCGSGKKYKYCHGYFVGVGSVGSHSRRDDAGHVGRR